MMNINLFTPVNSLGYGTVGLNVAKFLFDKCNLSLSIIGGVEVSNEQDAKLLQTAVSNSKLLDFDAPCVKIWHQNDMSLFMGRGKRIGFPIFELDSFTNIEKHHLKSLDTILVASEWARDIIISEDINVPVYVVPFGQNIKIDKPKLSTSIKTRFFTCGKWEVRKGHDKLIEAFNLAFTEDDDVELHMMCSNPFLNEVQTQQWKNHYINSRLGHKVRFISRVKSHEEVINIMNQMDCGVFISRAEGWNLELLEMICCGKPVIATNYSAHTEFCNNHNAMLVDIDENEPAYDGIWFNGKGGQWAKLGEDQIEQTIEYMRAVHKKKFINEVGFNKTRNSFTWDNTSMEILKYAK